MRLIFRLIGYFNGKFCIAYAQCHLTPIGEVKSNRPFFRIGPHSKFWHYHLYTVFQKGSHQTSGNNFLRILTDFQNSFTTPKRMKFTTKSLNIFHHTLSMFSHYLGKFNSSNLLQITTEKSKSVSYFTKMKQTSMLS